MVRLLHGRSGECTAINSCFFAVSFVRLPGSCCPQAEAGCGLQRRQVCTIRRCGAWRPWRRQIFVLDVCAPDRGRLCPVLIPALVSSDSKSAALESDRGVVLFGEALSQLSKRKIPVTMHRVSTSFCERFTSICSSFGVRSSTLARCGSRLCSN
jgi:hypothetical protein